MRVLDKKIQKVLSMNTTQNDIQEALDSFAEYYDTSENTVDSRKNLRYSLEGISCDLTKQFATELTRFCSVCLLSLLLCCILRLSFSLSIVLCRAFALLVKLYFISKVMPSGNLE